MKISPIILRLKTDFTGTIFEAGGITRVGGAADFDDIQRGSKVPVPAMFAMLGDTIVTQQSSQGVPMAVTKITETLVITVILSGKSDVPSSEDEIGQDAVDKIHDIKLKLFKSLHGFNPNVAEQQQGGSYGYCAKELRFSNDGFWDYNRVWYMHRFEFELESEITSSVEGVGPVQPQGTDDLLSIHTDFEPIDIDITEQPAIQSIITFPPNP